MKKLSIIETKDKVGENVEIYGWVHGRRDHGKLIFLDVRDRTGIIQVVFIPKDEETYRIADTLRNEWVVKIEGKIGERPSGMINENIETGKVELQPEKLTVLSESETPPFSVDDDGYKLGEQSRLDYRYIDLRRERLTKNIIKRHEFAQKIRQYLNDNGFLEIETPLLSQATKEGSRDFVVPSRIYPGKFYALPQAPQQYKQLLMASGFERYYQLARAMRDEDPRANKVFEHTQIDLEMSFVERDDVMALIEGMVTSTIESFQDKKITKKPFPVYTYDEAIKEFGDDKFDFRENKDDPNELAFAWVVDFPFFKKVERGDTVEERDGKSGWTFTHNPFSNPKEEFIEQHIAGKDVEKIITNQYDLVCNGQEVGGGSIRAHRPEVLEATYKIMGYNDKEIDESVGHIIKAFKYGAPPHGGIALGLDRLLMILTGEESIKEVIAFPMSGKGQTAIMSGPSEITKEQLDELGLKIVTDKEKSK